jgi:hypothetical protein
LDMGGLRFARHKILLLVHHHQCLTGSHARDSDIRERILSLKKAAS